MKTILFFLSLVPKLYLGTHLLRQFHRRSLSVSLLIFAFYGTVAVFTPVAAKMNQREMEFRGEQGTFPSATWERGVSRTARDCRPYLVTATSYSWREPEHDRYGRLNALGTRLDDTQISADWRFYPPGTRLWIESLGFRTVTDRGSAVRGPRHIDIHFSSLAAMRAWGTRRVKIKILSPRSRRLRVGTRVPSRPTHSRTAGGCRPYHVNPVARSATATTDTLPQSQSRQSG
jgi:3D (Asp-Asp-Asp) domain-containing protein